MRHGRVPEIFVDFGQGRSAVFGETIHVGTCGARVGDYDVDEADFFLDFSGG
jgi:hypothetical protein